MTGVQTCALPIWGAISGLLKAFRNLNEMIIGILLNYVALLFMGYLYAGPLMEANIPQTAAIEPADRLSRILPPTRVHAGILIALAVLILIYYYLYNTASGFRLRVVGNNPVAALVNGLPVKRMTVISFIASGAIDRKSTRLNSSHGSISYAVFCLKKKI